MSAVIESSGEQTPVLTLEVSVPDHSVAHRTFRRQKRRTIKIGSLASADVRVLGTEVARLHAAITLSRTEASIVDLGTRGGTRVNGERVHRARLHAGDVISIGPATLVVRFEDARPRPVAAVAPGPTAPTVPEPPPAPVVPLHPHLPRFDAGAVARPPRPIDRSRWAQPSVAQRPHPAIPPEEAVTADSCAVELRVFCGEDILDIQHHVQPQRLTIGESKKANVFISSQGLPVTEFPLLRCIDGEYVLSLVEGMAGEVERDGAPVALRSLWAADAEAEFDPDLDGVRRVTFAAGMRALVHWGGATFALRFVAPPRAVPAPIMRQIVDLAYLNTLVLSFFLHVTLAVTLLVYPYGIRDHEPKAGPDVDFPLYRDVLVSMPTPKPMPENKAIPAPEAAPDTTASEPSRRQARKARSTPSRRGGHEMAAQMRSRINSMLEETVGGNGLGGEPRSLSGTLQAAIGSTGRFADAGSLRGFAARGDVPASGTGFGTLRGTGGIVTRGTHGDGNHDFGRIGGLSARKHAVEVEWGEVEVHDPMDRKTIERVVAKHRKQMRFCYERRLTSNGDLAGKVAVSFVIGATGHVAKVKISESTMPDPEVERCIMRKIAQWVFPPPAGGGTVRVNYPFVFRRYD